MTVAAVPPVGVSPQLEGLNGNTTVSVSTVDLDNGDDDDDAAPRERSRPTLSAILRTTRQVYFIRLLDGLIIMRAQALLDRMNL